jgi:uncharacterized membrane protein YdbT with pleckstrin-like domain
MKIKKHIAILLTAILLFSTLAFTGCKAETPATDEDSTTIEESVGEETPEENDGEEGEEAEEAEDTEETEETENIEETEEDNSEDAQEE